MDKRKRDRKAEDELKEEMKRFTVSMEDKIKEVPDYVAVPRRKKVHHRLSVLARVLFGLLIAFLSVGLAFGIIFVAQDVLGFKKSNKTVLLEVKQNYGLSQIADELEEKGIINSALVFKAYYRVSKADVNFQYGTYSLESNMSYDTILNELGKYSLTREEVTVLFPEGITLYEMASLLQRNKVCNASEFIKTVNSTDFGFDFEKKVGKNNLRFHKMEGYLFPDTYNFYLHDNPVNVASKFLSAFDKKVTQGLELEMKNSTFVQDDLIILASIVQREAGKTDEMRRVASVYLNRLKNPEVYTRLQADPTRDYANELKLQMNVVDQSIIDAYNTYEGLGLPPGPICNPGTDAIKAVLDPEETDYFYFCTNLKTGEFYYAKTLEEHNVNVRKAGLR